MRARSARRLSVLPARTQLSSVERSSGVKVRVVGYLLMPHHDIERVSLQLSTRSLSGIRNHNLDLIVRAALRSAKSEAGTPALPHLFASERPQGPFSQPRHGFSLLIA